MESVTYKSFKDEMLRGTRRGVYVLHGNDSYLMGRAEDMITEGSEKIPVDLRKMDGEEISGPFLSFFSGRRTVIVEGLSQDLPKKKLEEFFDLLSDPVPELIVLIKDYSQDERQKPFPKQLEKMFPETVQCVLVNAGKPDERTALAEAYGYADEIGCTVDSRAMQLIYNYCDGDLEMMTSEIRKMSSYDEGKITADTVELLCTKSPNAWIYGLISKIERGDASGSMETLRELIKQKMEPATISSVLIDTYTSVVRAQSARVSGKRYDSMLEDFGLPANKRSEISWSKSGRYSDEQMKETISVLWDLDQSLKSSGGDASTALVEAVSKLVDILGSRRR
ncbi:MAG: DNA polymerase III subunit delta [Oscillospiraceae bacterium]